MGDKHPQCGHFVGTIGICRRCQPALWLEMTKAPVYWTPGEEPKGEPMFSERLEVPSE